MKPAPFVLLLFFVPSIFCAQEGLVKENLGRLPEKIMKQPFSTRYKEIARSSDGRHAAFVSQEGSRFVVVYDGKAGPKFDEIVAPPKVSAHGEHVAYVARKGSDRMMVLDQMPGPAYERFDHYFFSPDGKRFAYTAQKNSKWHVVIDGKESPPYAAVSNLQFSDDGKRVAYAGMIKPKGVAADVYPEWVVVVDGKEQPRGISINALQFSKTGGHFAYLAGTSKTTNQLVIDGKVQAMPGSATGRIFMSDDGEQVAVTVWHPQDRQHKLWLNGKEQVECLQCNDVLFSPAGRDYAVIKNLEKGGKMVIHNSKPHQEYQHVSQLNFSPDGSHLYYLARHGAKNFLVTDGKEMEIAVANASIEFSSDGKKMALLSRYNPYSVMIDGKEVGTLSPVNAFFTFSPDGNRYAFVTNVQNKGSSIQVDGKKTEPLNANFQGLTFTPDSRQVAYLIRRPQSCQVVVGDLLGPEYPYNCVQGPLFSGDGKHVAYLARTRGMPLTYAVIVNGTEVAQFDHIYLQEKGSMNENDNTFRFDADGRLRFLAVNDGTVYRVGYTPGNDSRLAKETPSVPVAGAEGKGGMTGNTGEQAGVSNPVDEKVNVAEEVRKTKEEIEKKANVLKGKIFGGKKKKN